MRQCIWVFLVGVVVPLVTSLVTYTFVSMGSEALAVDEIGALIIMVTIIKLVLLSTQGIFPIDMNEVLHQIIQRGKRSTNEDGTFNNSSLYQVPAVDEMPCIRRFLCEVEVATRTSDNYLPKEPEAVNDRILEEEVAPEEVDPISEMQVEAVRALYREEDPTGELSERGRRALQVVESMTGPACEMAYKLCPGRFTAPLIYRTIFEEINLAVSDHD
ncbi:uncharacterized protein [Procambarus clarkii]|uniref:uncharacterized protein n=1 Tax=Procambarus clarkii TaxID=6728 RepID=UPI003743AAC3